MSLWKIFKAMYRETCCTHSKGRLQASPTNQGTPIEAKGLITIDLEIKVDCFVKKLIIFSDYEAGDLN